MDEDVEGALSLPAGKRELKLAPGGAVRFVVPGGYARMGTIIAVRGELDVFREDAKQVTSMPIADVELVFDETEVDTAYKRTQELARQVNSALEQANRRLGNLHNEISGHARAGILGFLIGGLTTAVGFLVFFHR